MNFNSEEIGWPEDTVILSYHGIFPLLMQTAQALEMTGHVFVVSPKHQAIAMSRSAAMEIGVYAV